MPRSFVLGRRHRQLAAAVLSTGSALPVAAFAPATSTSICCNGYGRHKHAPQQMQTSVNRCSARFVTLPSSPGGDGDDASGERISVTGTIYEGGEGDPVVQLYTKFGCTLCDKVSDVLRSVRDSHPHTLEAVDITDEDKADWYDKYKYDIPVLHIEGKYWAKHRLTSEVAMEGLEASKSGSFEEQEGQPDAGAMERRQAEREA